MKNTKNTKNIKNTKKKAKFKEQAEEFLENIKMMLSVFSKTVLSNSFKKQELNKYLVFFFFLLKGLCIFHIDFIFLRRTKGSKKEKT